MRFGVEAGGWQYSLPPVLTHAKYKAIKVWRRLKGDHKARECIKIIGQVQWRQGDAPFSRWYRNHFVGQGLYGLTMFMSASGACNGAADAWTTNNTYTGITLGTDTVTATTMPRTALVSPIGGGLGTQPNTKSGVSASDTTSASVTYTGVWNSSTVTGTVGEMALWLYIPTALQTFSSGTTQTGLTLCSRLSVADGDFTAFTINSSLTLTVNWQVKFVYA